MSRISLKEGGWYDHSTTVVYGENTQWDGSNHISRATGSQYDHEQLHLTKGGSWVLSANSQWEGRLESATQVDSGRAAAWLCRNEYDSITREDSMTDAQRATVREVQRLMDELEV